MTHNTRDWEERFDERFIPNDGDIPTYIENGNDLKDFIHQELQKAREERDTYWKERVRKLEQCPNQYIVGLNCTCDKWHDRMEESNNNCSTCDKPIK